MSFASQEYFTLLFTLCDVTNLDQQIFVDWHVENADILASLLAGLVTSADTGNEDLVVVSRAALARFCEASSSPVITSTTSGTAPSNCQGEAQRQQSNLVLVANALVNNLRQYIQENQDRVVLPTLEVIAYLFHIGIFPGFHDFDQVPGDHITPTGEANSDPINLKRLCVLVQKAGYKTGSVRKLEACVRVYGEISRLEIACNATPPSAPANNLQKRREGVAEAKKRLAALLLHPWPRVRSAVVDELWILLLCQATATHSAQDDGQHDVVDQKQRHLAGVDWSKADKVKVKTLVENLGLGHVA